MSQSFSNPSQAYSLNSEPRFKELLEEYTAVLKSMGVKCIPYDEPSLPLFSKAPQERKMSSIAFLETALSAFKEVWAAGGDLRDNRMLIWRTLNLLKLIPDSTIFDKMSDDDVIEIYGLPDHVHLAWNIQLMTRVSFTAEQLLCLPWWELTVRPAEVMAEFQRLAAGLISEEYTKTLIPSVPRHRVQEIHSHELLTIEMDVKYVSPLRQGGRNVAFLVVNSSHIVGSQK